MITVKQLRQMPIGQRIGGGFVLTVKMTKKSVQLPNKKYIHSVVLCDETGEMLADFVGPPNSYLPMKKGGQVKIIVAEIQELVLKAGNDGMKLYVEQFETLTQTLDEYEAEIEVEALINQNQWHREIKGKIRHGIVCSMIQSGLPVDDILIHKTQIETLVKYVYNRREESETDV